MIVAATGPLDTGAGSVHTLYVALNSPVVTLDGLAAGPAAAGIALHRGGGAALAVRSLRSHDVAFFHAAAATAASDPQRGLAAAISHAESLGFLFDDEQPLTAEEAQEAWPAWLVEIFPAAACAAFLTKFRWSLPQATGAGGIGS